MDSQKGTKEAKEDRVAPESKPALFVYFVAFCSVFSGG